MIASPNTVNPNYLYTWIRDASLTMKLITQEVSTGEDASLRDKIDQFFLSQKVIQQIPNLSGSVSTGGLGEPKFNINQTAFTGSWGILPHSFYLQRLLTLGRSTTEGWSRSTSHYFHSLRELVDCER